MLIFLRTSKMFCIFVSVNKQVDIEKYLEEFRSEISRQHDTIKDLTDDVARLNRRVESQNVEIKSLKSENKDLRDLSCQSMRSRSRQRTPTTAVCRPPKNVWVTKSRGAHLRCERKAGRTLVDSRDMKAIPA